MNRYKYKAILTVITLFFSCIAAFAQNDSIRLEGLVVKSYKSQPVSGAVVTVTGHNGSIMTDDNGKFSIMVKQNEGTVSVWYPGFYTNVQPIAGRTFMKVMLISEDKVGYSNIFDVPFTGLEDISNKQSALNSKQKSNIDISKTELTQTFTNIPGLQLIEKSGMPGEGTYFSVRGVNTLMADASPLLVVNGVPYMPDKGESGIIGGFSKDILSAIHAQDIRSITLLKGAEAAIYGSMGANGVLMIETDKATDLDTKVELISQFGLDYNQSTIPVMGVKDYKSYIGNVSLTRYDDMAEALAQFPYLVDNPNYYYNYLYNNNTDWQDQIYRTGFTTDHVLKIKGGDAIAKYDVSIGYKNKEGQVKGTDYQKYYARLNSDVNLSRDFSFTSTIYMSSVEYNAQEQGLIEETNPVLAAMKKGPIFATHKKDVDNNILPGYSTIRDADGKLMENNKVSNPLTLTSSLKANSRSYDVMINLGLNYKLNQNITLRAIGGLFYNYNNENLFVPGKTDLSVMPLNYQAADNTVRAATGETTNYYYGVNGTYINTFDNVHSLTVTAGMQSTINTSEYDAGTAYNSASDYYQTLRERSKNDPTIDGYSSYGYINKWNWINMFATANYVYNKQYGAGLTIAADASSSVGEDASLFHLYPAVNVAWYAHNSLLKDVDLINRLAVRAEYASTGNSRISSSYSKYNYGYKLFREQGGIVRDGIPNYNLKPERNNTVNLGLDFSLFNNRVDVTFDYYNTKIKDMVIPVSISSAFGVDYYYDNAADAKNRGIELGFNILALSTRDFKWYLGGSIAWSKNEVTSLGGNDDLVLTMNNGSAIITQKGQPIYSFYGYKTNGVFATSQEAETAYTDKNGATGSLKMANGETFKAGDIHFVDQNGDGIIDDRDRVNLGSADPTYYGSFNTTVQYKSFELSANFGFSVGNKMYNATRQSMESMKDFTNQNTAVNNRWIQEGQVTSMPKAAYGDPMGNSRFSDRWIETASYLKLKELMLSYKFNFMAGITVYASAENLFTVTDYLGLDPETMYSYDAAMRGFDNGKVGLPRSFKLGFKLQF